jgi:hypothetical protein
MTCLEQSQALIFLSWLGAVVEELFYIKVIGVFLGRGSKGHITIGCT